MRFHAILLGFVTFFSWALKAQESFIKVLDDKGAPLEFAHIVVISEGEKNQLWVTDYKGMVANTAKKKSILSISFTGYQTLVDTIFPNKSYTFKLETKDNNLQDVVVTGQYGPVSEKNSVFKVKVLTKDRIESRGAVTLNQVLNDQLNIRITQDNATGSQISMQGLGGANIKILVDGVPLVGRIDNNVDLSQINLDDIERIEIVEGPLSVAYGSNAIAGTINLITKKAKANQYGFNASNMYESVGLTTFNFQGNYGFKNAGVKAGFGRNFFQGWDPNPDVRNKQWNQKEQWLANTGFTYKKKNWSGSTDFRYIDEVIKDRGNKIGEFSDYAFDTWFNTKRFVATSQHTYQHNNPKYTSQILGGYNLFWRSRTKYLRNLVTLEQAPTADPDDHDTSVFNGVNVRYTFTGNPNVRANYQLGIDANYEDGRGDRIEGNQQSIHEIAVFGSIKWNFTENFEVQPGLRYAYNSNYNAPVIPSIFMRYQFSKRSTLRFSYAHGYRTPSLKELYMEFVDANHNILGNNELQPEESKNINLVYAYQIPIRGEVHNLTLEPSLFFNDLKNNIILNQEDGTLFTYQNLAENRTFGGKFQFKYLIHPGYTFRTGVSYLGFLNQNYTPENDLPEYLYTPEVVAGFDYWRPSNKFNFNITYKYTGKTPGFRTVEGELTQVFIEDYHMLDMSVTQKFFKKKLGITLGAKNLFDVTNVSSALASGGAHSSGANSISWGKTIFVAAKFTL